MDIFTRVNEILPNFDLMSFCFGISYSAVIVSGLVYSIYIVPLIFRFLKWLIEKIIFYISKRNSPPSGEDK